MADDRSIRVRFVAEYQSYLQGLRSASAATKNFGREISGQGNAVKADVEKVGRAALVMSTGMAVALGASAKAAIDWESAWAGVTKTVDGTEAQMADLEEGLRDLAKELPSTHAEIAAVAEAAGALGIQRDAIESFTKTMIDLGETTDLTADQAATAMAQIANVMQTPQTEFDRMGATLVDLGNNGASTESEILELANRLAAAGEIAGLTEADVFSFASTLASVGVEAEAGGTALSKVFTRVRDAVIDGGAHLEKFAEVAGTTTEEFAAAFRADPSDAIEQFISGLGRMNDSGKSTSAVFKDLELNDERLKRALLSTAGAGELLADQIDLGRKAWEENLALQTEAEKRYDTTAAKLEILRNNVVDLGINLGEILLPAISGSADALSTLAQGFSAMPAPLKVIGAGIGGMVFGVTALIAGAALLSPAIDKVTASLARMGAVGAVINRAIPWLAAAATAAAAVAYVVGQNAKEAEEAEARVKGFTDAIREAGDAAEGTRNHLAALAEENPALTELLDKTGMSLDDLAAAASGTDEEWNTFVGDLKTAAGDAELSNDALALLMIGLDRVRTGAQEGADEADRLGRVIGETGDAADTAGPAVGSLADELGLNADEAKRAREEFEDLLDAYRASVDPLFGMLDALEANREAQGAEAAARAEGAKQVAEASDAVAQAEKDLRDARGKEDNAEGIAAAEERLADARERLTEVQDDAVISAEELAAMNQAVAESALDVDVASKELAARIAEQPGLLSTAIDMLQSWVDKGLITETQAANMKTKFEEAAYAAGLLDGEFVADFFVNSDEAEAALDRMIEKWVRIIQMSEGGIDAAQAEKFLARETAKGAATGGVVGPSLGPPQPSDTVPMRLTPGEGVVNLKGMSMLGPAGLDALNAGMLTAAPSSSNVSTAYDHSRNWSPQFVIDGSKGSRDVAGTVLFEMKTMAALS